MSINTADKVKFIRNQKPSATLQEIGTMVNRTRERIRQILNKLGLPTKAIHTKRLCPICNKEIATSDKRYCSRECLSKSYRQLFICEVCGQPFALLNSVANARVGKGGHIRFCSKYCQGKWLGQNYGKGAIK